MSKMSMDEVVGHIRDNTPLNKLRAKFSGWCGRIDQAQRQHRALNPVDMRRMEFEAVQEMAREIVSEEAIARAICRSGKFETGQGTCAPICMGQLGDARTGPCRHAASVHKKLAAQIAAALVP